MNYKILRVEDDAVIADQIGKQIEKWDMEPVYVKDFADGVGIGVIGPSNHGVGKAQAHHHGSKADGRPD